MSVDKKKKERHELPDIDAAWEDDADAGDRPTLTPPFDLERYAKATTAPTSEVVIGQRAPNPDAGDAPLSDSAATVPPPESPAMSEAPFSQRKTPRSMPRLEVARKAQGSDPPGSRDNLLAFADRIAPSDRPGGAAATAATVAAPEAGSALDLVARHAEAEPAAQPPADPVIEMRERFALGDYSGALVMAESLLEDNPSHTEAREYADSCRSVLQQMYTARIGPLDRVPIVEVARDQLRWLSIDHRAGFMLSLVDGVSSLEMILDVSGMPTLDALRILFELVQQRIISFKAQP